MFLTRLQRWHQQEFLKQTDHIQVVRSVTGEGRFTGRFAFMTLLSGAIAVLGLLLSSPAVIIGAMLLSPLMGPIMAMGFALCILDLNLLKASLLSLVGGIILALAITYSIVHFSPISDATPEILARTQPNLFDLLVAIFAGLAGGYATIKHKGETIVGVAIATALMPPLAVVGYGLATGQWKLTEGASLLFMTNLLAIALSVTVLAKWYGFGAHHSPKHAIWQTALILGVFGALSLPLGVALKNIAYKGYITKTAQTLINNTAAANQCRVAQFNIAFPEGKPVEVRATLLTQKYIPDTEQFLEAEMIQKIGQPVKVDIDQLIVAHAEEEKTQEPPQIAVNSNPLAAPAASVPTAVPVTTAAPSPEAEIIAFAKNTLMLPIKAQQVNAELKTISFIIGSEAGLTDKARRNIEKNIRERFPAWTIILKNEPQADEKSKGQSIESE